LEFGLLSRIPDPDAEMLCSDAVSGCLQNQVSSTTTGIETSNTGTRNSAVADKLRDAFVQMQ